MNRQLGRFAAERHGWLQVVRGELDLGKHALQAGDGVALSFTPDDVTVIVAANDRAAP